MSATTTMAAGDADLLALADTLARFRADQPGLAGRGLWWGLARELGVLGAALPEAQGGLGGGWAEHATILQALGETLGAEPYLGSALVAGGVLHRSGSPREQALLAGLVSGELLPAWAHDEPGQRGGAAAVACTLQAAGGGWRLTGRKRAVVSGPVATHYVVSARRAGRPGEATGLDLVLVEAGALGLQRRDLPGLDGQPISELQFDGVSLQDGALLAPPGTAGAAIAQALDDETLGLCAEALGLTQRLLHDTIAHARERRQFGQPLAAFQVLQHRIADMHIARELAAASTQAVVSRLASGGPIAADERSLAVSSARVAVDRALRSVGQGAVQIHGAMGVTEELAAGRLFRRATQILQSGGGTSWHLRRVDQLTG